MAQIKFSCPECGQHIACGEPWFGHQLACPTCHNTIVVPKPDASSGAPPPPVPLSEVSKTGGPRLTAGVTQVPRSPAPAPATANKFKPHPPRADNVLLKYGLMLVVVAALGGVGYFYGLPLLTKASEQESGASAPQGAATSQSGSRRAGPMGEVNEAMDVSDALDGGSAPKPRPVSATNGAARARPAAARR